VADALACWGSDDDGQSSPPSGRFATVAAGSTNSCAIALPDGAITCWGDTTGFRSAAPAGAFVALDLGATHGCALGGDGEIACWGQRTDGRTDAHPGPFVRVDVSDEVTCGITDAGAASCWGSGSILSLPAEQRFRLFSWNFFRGCGVTLDDDIVCWDLHGGAGTIPELDIP
jgi:hypothetical protein